MAQKYYYLDFEGLQRYDAIVEQKIADAIGEVVNFHVEVVTELPSTGDEHILYLLKKDGSDHCDEYVWDKTKNDWELIGTTEIDLSEYATKDELNAGLALKANIVDVSDALNSKADKTSVDAELALKANQSDVDAALAEKQNNISDLDTIRSGAAAGATALQSVPAEYVTETELNGSLANYATTNALINGLAEKADIIEVSTSLALKADKAAVNASLADIELALSGKASTDYVNEQLALKADQEYVDASLALKANASELEALITRISDLENTVVTLRDDLAKLDREVNAVSYDINEAIAGIKGQRTIYTDPEERFIIDASTSTSKYTLIMLGDNVLGNYVVPADIDKAITIDGSIKNGATITSESIKTVTINNKSVNPVDIAIVSNGTVNLTGNFNDVEFDDGTLNGVGSEYANINGNVIISDDAAKATTINANFVGENNTVISNTSQAITINAKNENANIAIECPNSTVTVNGIYDEVEANVADDTLKFASLNTHINTLHLKHGNIFINNGKNVINDLVGNIVADSSYIVDWNKATILPNSPAACEYTLSEDKNNPVTWGAFASGDTVINLNNHNIHNEGTDGRPTLNVRNAAHVDINGEGNVSNNKEYCVWGNGVNTVITINGGHFSGATHVIYSYNGLIEINGGEFELVGEYEKDAKGHAKFLLNCYDQSFTAGTARIIVKGGKFHNFNPAEAYGEPTQPYNYVAEGYESVCIDEANQIYEVRKL